MNRRDLLSPDGKKVFGQCFLCGGEHYLTPRLNAKLRTTYVCTGCGAMNSARRIEDGLNINGQPLRRSSNGPT